MSLKVSVITSVYNRVKTIESAVQSVVQQTYPLVEHVCVDGMSNDGTSDVLQAYSDRIDRIIREPDSGIYDALNKGIAASTGDVIGFLHADDILHTSDSLAQIAASFADPQVDAVYGDLLYVDHDDTDRIIRYWKSGDYERRRFWRGWMPPHTTIYVRRHVYEDFGGYRTDFGSGADYEWIVRAFIKGQIKAAYCPQIIVKMRVGGASNESLRTRFRANLGDHKAWLANELKPPFGIRLTKPLSKLSQYIVRPAKNR